MIPYGNYFLAHKNASCFLCVNCDVITGKVSCGSFLMKTTTAFLYTSNKRKEEKSYEKKNFIYCAGTYNAY